MFIVLVLVLLCFGGSLAIKCASKNNEPCLIRPTLIDLNFDELHYYPFIICMSKYNRSCNTVEDPFGRICVPNKMEDLDLKVFHMIKGINESRTLEKHILCECRCEFDGRKCNLRQKLINDTCNCECKKSLKHRAYEVDYDLNPSACACKCDKDCEIGQYLKDCECMKSIFDDLVVTCDEIINTPETISISLSGGINYWLIAVVLLAIACLLLLVVVVKFNIKHGLTIPCSLSY